jgi:cytochrome b561
MQLRNSVERYGAVPQALHWLTAVLVALAWLLGTFGDDLPGAAAQAAGLFAHMSAGLAVLVLLVVRLGWRLTDPPPTPEATPFGRWGERAAMLGHLALYALLVAVPILGIVLQFARGHAIPLFGLAEIASPWPADRAFAHSVKEVHETAADALMIVAGLHAAAALVHNFVLRDRTLKRMLPFAAARRARG